MFQDWAFAPYFLSYFRFLPKILHRFLLNGFTEDEHLEKILNKVLDSNSTNNIIEEVENMDVRKAETLSSLDELSLSKRAKNYLASNFDSLDEIIWYGRSMAYDYARHPEEIEKSKKSTVELVEALEEAGFIRHDIDPRTFTVGWLYHMLFLSDLDTAVPISLGDLSVTIEKMSNGKIVFHISYRMGNKKYESFENFGELDTVVLSLRAILPEKEYEIFAYRLGFEDGNPHDILQTSRRFCISRERVRQLESKGLRRLRKSHALPPILQSSDEQKAEVAGIVREYEELIKDPIHKREAELLDRLSEISKMPFDCAKEAAKYLDGNISGYSDIGRLGLSVRAHNCLKRADINTVADIIKLPKEDWPKVRNLGSRAMQEIEEKVRAAGYANFSVSVLS